MSANEKELINAVAQALSYLGMPTGYLSCGDPATRRLQKALAAYGIEPKYFTMGRERDPVQ